VQLELTSVAFSGSPACSQSRSDSSKHDVSDMLPLTAAEQPFVFSTSWLGASADPQAYD